MRRSPGFAALGWDDVQFAVRLEKHIVLGLAEDDPLAVRGVLGEEVALAVERGPGQRFRFAAPAAVEGDAVEIELEGLSVFQELAAVGRVQEHRSRAAAAP